MSTDKFRGKYRIPSARHPRHDYNGGLYFITICTSGMEYFFGEITDSEMQYSELGKYAKENLENITSHYPDCIITEYTVMPNHLHAIVVVDETGKKRGCADDVPGCRDDVHIVSMPTPTRWKTETVDEKMQIISHRRGRLSVSIAGLKRAVTAYANQQKIPFEWQERFHDHIIRNQGEYDRIARYIRNNPKRWQDDKFYRNG